MWEGRACGARRELGAFPAEKPTAGVGDRYTGRVIPAGTRSTGSVFRYVPVLASSWPQEPLFGWSGGDSVEGFVVAASLPVDEFNSPGRTRLSVRPRLFSVVGLGYVGLGPSLGVWTGNQGERATRLSRCGTDRAIPCGRGFGPRLRSRHSCRRTLGVRAPRRPLAEDRRPARSRRRKRRRRS